MKKILLFGFLCSFVMIVSTANAQPDRPQQRIKYTIQANVDVASNKINGTEKIVYTNNSSDTLNKIFFHTYWNAFQPGSSMDIRSRELGQIQIRSASKFSDGLDWDARVKDRISKLSPSEIGYQHIKQVKINGVAQVLKEHETILEVVLAKAVLPKSSVQMEVEFEAQVPLQVEEVEETIKKVSGTA